MVNKNCFHHNEWLRSTHIIWLYRNVRFKLAIGPLIVHINKSVVVAASTCSQLRLKGSLNCAAMSNPPRHSGSSLGDNL